MLAPFLGLLAGIHHALTGPDHLAGVAPLAAGQGGAAWRVGARWGLGHVAGASLAALAALALRERIPGLEERLSGVSELVVGGALMVIGALALRAAVRLRLDDAPHRHGALEHRHWHVPAPGPARHPHAAFWLGTLHGAAGLSHLFAVLPALVFPGWWQPVLYLAGYGAGSLAAITGFTALLGRLLPGHSERVLRLSMAVAGAASLLVGAAWITLSL